MASERPPAPTIITSPATPKRGHRTRGSIASPITPSITSPTARKWSHSATPQYTSPLDFEPPNFEPRSNHHASAVSADPLSHPQLFVGGILSTIVLVGTMYSIFYETSLDTSIASLLPDRKNYLATKGNIFNQWFVKKSWGWTTFAWISHWISSPPSVSGRKRRLTSFVLATMAWIGFAIWFFGASLNHRLIAYSGGQCALSLPRTNNLVMETIQDMSKREVGREAVWWGDWVLVPVPSIFCTTSRKITRKNSPRLFNALESAGVSNLASLIRTKFGAGGKTRWHAGFDISGHMFLLTLSSLILARELAPSWKQLFGSSISSVSARRASRSGGALDRGLKRRASSGFRPQQVKKDGELGRGGMVNRLATLFGTALIGLWGFMLGVTAVYFHNPPEKLAGLALGLIVAGCIHLVTPSEDSALSSIPARTINALSRLDETAASDEVFGSLTGLDENAARRGQLEENVIVDDDITPTNTRDEEKKDQ